jgi:hypothetical protein
MMKTTDFMKLLSVCKWIEIWVANLNCRITNI